MIGSLQSNAEDVSKFIKDSIWKSVQLNQDIFQQSNTRVGWAINGQSLNDYQDSIDCNQ